jgi:FtsP/CotA-like multicopper oxidase with cupredoxin domain
MNTDLQQRVGRRAVLRGAGVIAAVALLAPKQNARAESEAISLTAKPAEAYLLPGRTTKIWSYNGLTPGPLLRARQGESFRVDFKNALPVPTTVHWHGIRLPNAMDGVPHLTQPPVEPLHGFTYAFAPPDAGTFWYHPHEASAEQVDRGLYGALIVEEKIPPRVDQDIVWVLDDWRLAGDGQLLADYGDPAQIFAAGRIGTTVTINSERLPPLGARFGERIRLRLINAANARIFALTFEGHLTTVIALDGQPLEPFLPDGGRIVVAPGQRCDLILDMMGLPGRRYVVREDYYSETSFALAEIVYLTGAPVREARLRAPVALTANPLPEPDLAHATLITVLFGGGGSLHRWTVNGVAHYAHDDRPIAELALGRTYRFHLHNDTDYEHPIHLHGHAFRVLMVGGEPVPRREWRDTVLIPRRQAVEVAFVADNPGNWMLHCHILEHQGAGMMAVIRVV